MQLFRETYPTADTNIFQDNIDQIDNDNTLRSMFSGDSFPTNPAPVVGQPCYRTDLKKLFIYTADGWIEIMGKPIYDPRSISADVFHMDNMTEGANTKIMTMEERNKIIYLENELASLKNYVNNLTLVGGGWDVILEHQMPPLISDPGPDEPNVWKTRYLNTVVYNNDILISLENDRFTLPAGSYCIDWDAPASNVGVHQTRLYNFTTTMVVAYGTGERALSNVSTRSFGTTVVTINNPSSFEIQHCSEALNSSSVALPWNTGIDVETRVRIKKIN